MSMKKNMRKSDAGNIDNWVKNGFYESFAKATNFTGFQTLGGQPVGHLSLVHQTTFGGSPPTRMTS